ncbi:Cytochrome c551 peroxidase [Marinobacterium lacunae]|uniref:Cytochrome c551 peroxidase n=1 Tax=Marinobacterium lacunae TaxID=1232683 RepID=A0A081G187_9GAMM|nr:cytochrome c peroxidase [Marinobacterium lacunae]KEA64542.1 Cytochrome c551 peroxidase [Marinobacterium lacunae]
MKRNRHLPYFVLSGLAAILISGCQTSTQTSDARPADTLAELGQRLFFDPALSLNRTQSCSSCHDPAHAFTDPKGTADSLGDDGHSHGGRNAPTASYAALAPEFHRAEDGSYKGGQFHDGRASTLADQAMGPPLNPAEMGMTSKALVISRLAENPFYRSSFSSLFDDKVLQDPERGYRAMAESIAAFEQTALFSPFDSKYDRYLRGEYTMTPQEELGRTLFFSQQFTNCNQCHQLKRSPIDKRETFTDYSYRNIGVPANPELKRGIDLGLAANSRVEGAEHEGKFKVPTLRNVAVTGPYMHNGVFKDLRTVVLFYDHYNSRNPARAINPETGNPWGKPEVDRNLSEKELTSTPALDNRRVDALVAFMRTLTDKRYEPLLEAEQ